MEERIKFIPTLPRSRDQLRKDQETLLQERAEGRARNRMLAKETGEFQQRV